VAACLRQAQAAGLGAFARRWQALLQETVQDMERCLGRRFVLRHQALA
jgi:hypothetical protein